jgi:hypothetical protein
MRTLVTTALIGALAGPPFSHIAITSAQQAGVIEQPIFRVTVVGRTTAAINYRPEGGDTKVDLVGTPLLPAGARRCGGLGQEGVYRDRCSRRQTVSASQFGREYLTYVLWAITPEGRPKNLGEMKIRDNQSRLEVTTELQAFALLVTAEPYFAVAQPSDVVVIENSVRNTTKGKIETVEANYELLRRGSYLRDQSATFTPAPLEPGTPLDLAEARNAVALARIAGAEGFAANSFAKAARLLAEAEGARAKGKRGNEVLMAARQAAQTAEDARLIASQRQEEAFNAQQRAIAAQRERDALDRAQAEETRRRNAEEAAIAARAAAERETSCARARA